MFFCILTPMDRPHLNIQCFCSADPRRRHQGNRKCRRTTDPASSKSGCRRNGIRRADNESHHRHIPGRARLIGRRNRLLRHTANHWGCTATGHGTGICRVHMTPVNRTAAHLNHLDNLIRRRRPTPARCTNDLPRLQLHSEKGRNWNRHHPDRNVHFPNCTTVAQREFQPR